MLAAGLEDQSLAVEGGGVDRPHRGHMVHRHALVHLDAGARQRGGNHCFVRMIGLGDEITGRRPAGRGGKPQPGLLHFHRWSLRSGAAAGKQEKGEGEGIGLVHRPVP